LLFLSPDIFLVGFSKGFLKFG